LHIQKMNFMKPFFIKKILIPVDFSFTSLKAVDHAVSIAKLSKAEIILLHVIENIHSTTDPLFFAVPREATFDSDLMRLSNESLERVTNRIKSKGYHNVRGLAISGRTHTQILKVSKRLKVDLIVMGTHGVSGFREFIMGSNAYRVVTDATCPVLTVQRRNKATGFKNILVPFTANPHSREKVGFAIKVAEMFGSKISVLGFDTGLTKAHSKKILLQGNQIQSVVGKHNLECNVKITEEPYTAKIILDYSKEINADLLTVIGNIDKRDITEYFKGSLAQQLINHSEIPVLSIHAIFNPETIDLRFY
jgi:nucleotide-binding universal stress UspA family protein